MRTKPHQNRSMNHAKREGMNSRWMKTMRTEKYQCSNFPMKVTIIITQFSPTTSIEPQNSSLKKIKIIYSKSFLDKISLKSHYWNLYNNISLFASLNLLSLKIFSINLKLKVKYMVNSSRRGMVLFGNSYLDCLNFIYQTSIILRY